jgi:hypothetical protein
MIDAAAVGRYMSNLSYKTTKNYELANTLSRLSDDLETFGTTVFAKRWNDFTSVEKKIIIQCKQMMENEQENKNDLGQVDPVSETDNGKVRCTLP